MGKNAYCKILQWDTEFFGCKIAQIIVNRLDRQKLIDITNWCQQNKIDCIYFLANTDDDESIRLAEDLGFRLVDIRMTFEYNIGDTLLSESSISNNKYQVRLHRKKDISSLERIARDCHRDTRFFYDPCFSDDVCRKLYATWIKRSCEGYADQVFVAEKKGEPIGYISCHLNRISSIGQIGLLGVSQKDRDRTVGKMLLLNSLKWFTGQQIEKIRVVTQGRNIAAQRFYEGFGFRTSLVQIWYHKWFTFCGIEKSL